MRFRLLAVALGAIFLALTGFRPGTLPYIPNATYSDATISHFPAALFLRQSVLEHGEFPLWRDTLLGGQPFAANPLNKTAYPLQWLALLFPADVHIDLMAALHLLLAGWGMARWAESLGLSSEAATLSGLAYALAPRMIAHLGAGHLDVVYALAWWPWLMEAVYAAVEQPARPVMMILRLSLFAALVLLADVRVALFALALAVSYSLYGLIRARRVRARLWLVTATLPFLLLTVSLLLPLLGWQSYLTRGNLTAGSAALYSLTLWQWAGLLALPVYSGSHELLTFVGLPVLILAVYALIIAPRRHAFFGLAAGVGALYALGSNGFLWSGLIRIVPALIWFRVPSRAWLVITLIAPLLAGFGAQALVVWLGERHAGRAARRAMRWIVVLMAVSLAAGVAFFASPLPNAVRVATSVSLLIGGFILALYLLVAMRGGLPRRWLMPALVLVTVADLGWFGLHWLTWRGPEDWLAPYAALGERLASEHPTRIYAPIYALRDRVVESVPQQIAAVYGLRLFSGADPFQLRGPAAAIIAASGMNSSGYDIVLPYLTVPSGSESAPVPDTRLLAAWDVSHVVSVFPIQSPRLEPDGGADGAYIYRNLDFIASTRTGVPDWPPDAANVPDAATLERLNPLTLISAAVSGASFIIIVLVLIVDRLRRGAKAVPA